MERKKGGYTENMQLVMGKLPQRQKKKIAC